MGKTFLKKISVAVLGFTLPSLAFAAGLGRLTVLSGLGQPLKAEIEVVALQPGEADTLSAALASVETFRQSNVEFTSTLQSIRFAIERRPNNQYVIALTASQPMNEPFIDLLVELTWSSGRLVREYTFLLDPPELKPTVATATLPVVPPVATPLPTAVTKPAAAAAVAEPVRAPVDVAAAAKPGSTKPSGQYEVKRGDTLAKIASQNMAPGASLQQMLAAMYRANEEAFDGKNMNRLRTGRILNLPGAEEAQSISQAEASRLVASQASDYASFQSSVGAAVASAPARAEGTRQAAGRITAPASEKPAAKGPATDQLRLSKPDEAKGAGRSASAASADDLAAKDKALREAQERVALLEKNVQDLQKLLQLKNSAGAQAQKQAESKGEAGKAAAPAAKAEATKSEPVKPAAPAAPAAKAEPPKAEPTKAPAEAPKAAAPASTPAPAKPEAEAPKAAEPAKPAAEGVVAPDVPKAAPKPAPKAPPPPPPPPPDFIDELLDNELALGGAGGVLVLLGGYAAYAWRRKKKAASDAGYGDGAASIAPVAAASIASSAMGSASDLSSVSGTADSGQSAAPTPDAEEIDPIAEADVYMAYGRDAQAEEILKEALGKDMNRTQVWVKLLEIYANRKDAKTFESTAIDLQSVSGGQGPDWERAVALGLELDPTNPLYGGSGGATVDVDFGSTQILPAEPEAAVPVDIAVAPQEEAPGAALDFDLDLGGDATAQEGAGGGLDLDLGGAAEPADAAAASGGSGVDFDLGMGGDAPAAEASASDFSPETSEPAPPESPAAPAESGGGLDFDLGMGDAPAAEAVPELAPEPAPADDAGSVMDFNLMLDDTPAAPAPEAPAADIDLSALSLDLGTDNAAESAPMDAKWQEVATKLDLAKAYEEMGDKDGARDLLNEVLHEGDAAQKQQAQAMMATLD